ncbi:MAG: hypothetical protein H7836_08095 [Magnetococcus sp. YQC-3]
MDYYSKIFNLIDKIKKKEQYSLIDLENRYIIQLGIYIFSDKVLDMESYRVQHKPDGIYAIYQFLRRKGLIRKTILKLEEYLIEIL